MIIHPPYIKPKNFLYHLTKVVRDGIPAYADSRANPRVVGTPDWEKFWNEELYKIASGFSIGSVWIPGFFYYYMNYKQMSTIKGVVTPDMVDLHLELAYYIEFCKANGKNLLCAKGRRKGISEAASTMIIDYGYRFSEGYKGGVAAGNKTYVEDFLAKWRFSNSRLPPELSLKTLVDNDDEIIAGYTIRDNNNAWVEKGTFNTIYARTMHTNPNMFKGLYLNDIISEEIGEHEKWIEFFGASKDCLMSGNQQVGTLTAFGCVCAGTKVWDNYGNFVNIEDLKHENGIVGFNKDSGSASKEFISYWQPPTEKMCYRITTNTGRYIECSEDHPILVRRRQKTRKRVSYKKGVLFVETKDLVIGDNVATIEEVPFWSQKRMFEPRIIGWAVGDGTYGVSKNGCFNILMASADDEVFNYISSKYQTRVGFSAPTKDGRTLRKFRINGVYLKDSFREMGIVGQTKDKKHLPKDIHSYCKKDVCEFIGGYFDADGCIYYNHSSKETFLKLTSAHYHLLDEMRFLLQKIGVKCNIMYEKPKLNNKLVKTINGHYNLIIKDRKSIICFHDNIYFKIKRKQIKFNRAVKNISNNNSLRKSGVEKGIRFETIDSIECIGMKPIYNLTAATTNTYVANGIITHNTGGNINKGSKDFKDVWHDAERYNFVKFLIPATRFYFYGGATELNRQLPPESAMLKTYQPYQLIGVEDVELSKKHILTRREEFAKKGNMKAYHEDLQNNPVDETEIFKKTVVNNFDTNKLNAQDLAISTLVSPKYTKYKMEWVKDKKTGMIKMPYEVDLTPISVYDNQDECVLIIDTEHPRKNHFNLYSCGLDSYDQDTAKTSKSLGAMCIFIRDNSIKDAMKRAPVAVISCRPRRKEKFYEMCLQLAVYYNLIGNVLVDIANGLIIQYFKEHGCARYLAIRPVKFESESSEQTAEFGVRLTNFSRPRMIGLMQTHILDHCQDIWFPELINQLGNYDEVEIGSDNDLADAYGIALMQDVSVEVKPYDFENEKDDDRWKLTEYTKNSHGDIVPKIGGGVGVINPHEDNEAFGLLFGTQKNT